MSVDLEQLKKLDKGFKRAGKILMKKRLPAAAEAFGVKIKEQARRLVPVDTAELRLSIDSDLKKEGGKHVVVVGSNKGYARAVEFGRPPGTMVNPASPRFQKWAKKKGLNPYAVAHVIRRRGTDPQPYLDPAVRKMNRFRDSFIKGAINASIRDAFKRA
jgi:hypothetical protein